MIWKWTLVSILFAASFAGAWAADEAPRTVSAVDLSRYLGKWYEIARYPNRFQDFCAGDVTAFYEVEKPGRLKVVNQCVNAEGELKTAEGVAKVVEGSGNARLKVRFAPAFLGFLPFVWGDYWILELDPGYQWALVGSPNRKYLWILSRQPSMDEAVFDRLVDKLRAQGFDPARLVRTPQSGASKEQ